jgi:DNA invertase Pin-like site-specific DNA recombinase
MAALEKIIHAQHPGSLPPKARGICPASAVCTRAVLGMVAEMELGFIKARQRDGIERAKSKGDVYKGRKPTIDPSVVRDLFNEGIGASEIARRLKIGRASVYRVLEL